MLIPSSELLENARKGHYAVGAFNIYNLEGVTAVIAAAETCRSPVILQILPSALELGGTSLIALALEAGRTASVPVSVHLDHCGNKDTIRTALDANISSVMADGSHLPYDDNVAFTREIMQMACARDASVEAELGRLSGTEDGLTIAEYEACLTDPDQASHFVRTTGVHALAVCIGNIHGKYSSEPEFDFQRLKTIRDNVSVPLVLHGTSGVPDDMIRQSIELGVCKFNINTDIRSAYIEAAREYLKESESPELVGLMQTVIHAMKVPVMSKMALFGSEGKGDRDIKA